MISEVSGLADTSQKITYDYNNASLWQDEGYSQVILQRDTAFELDGVGFNLATSSDISDGIIVVGDELGNISANRNFARICLVQLENCNDEQEYYKLIKKIDYVKYHYFPSGYMIRTTSRSHKESVRVAKRCFVMAKKAGATDRITLTGGGAKNDGLKAAIEKVLKIKVVELSTDPQLMGALGAAEYARQKGLAQVK